ncbi:NAD(P)-dependent oxidoreductase [Actinomycetospora straminea]|uniref:NAD(P)-dependent oxidoreductase n=1 Tax=Actinomycetospora straminea TaxID=663607 RepID=UPI002365091A|nr:NAD(P)H-binding protein [Actinomycetospora straminea]MDD7935342.1 NAD(P)H-binding protein [Actinomycetospora straminea]
MDVTVFGGTGKIGRLVVRRLLDEGHRVTALVRSPEKLALESDRLEVIVAQLDDEPAIRKAVDGADAVISALGPAVDPFLRSGPLTAAMRTIVAAMHEAGVRRLVALSTVSVPDPRDRPSLVERLVPAGIGFLIPGALEEVQGMAEAVTTSDLDWTLARMFAPIDIPSNGTLRAGFLGRDDVGTPMARTDVAAFLVDQLTDDRFVGAAPAISN